MRNGISRRKPGMRTALAAATAVIGLGATTLTALPAAAAEESSGSMEEVTATAQQLQFAAERVRGMTQEFRTVH